MDTLTPRTRYSPLLSPDAHSVTLHAFNLLCEDTQVAIQEVLRRANQQVPETDGLNDLKVPRYIDYDGVNTDLLEVFSKILAHHELRASSSNKGQTELVDFEEVNVMAQEFASYIEQNKAEIVRVLTQYETHEVAQDEINRVLDLFRNLRENVEFFQRRVGLIASYLPINQPLYSLACFSIVPSFMAERVFARPPVVARQVIDDLSQSLGLNQRFPNLMICAETRSDFEKKCKANNVQAIIFTGKMENANQVKKAFGEEVLFIVNGAGHNPIVISDDADIDLAVSSALRVQLYNQGQDCANPSAILVHRRVHEAFIGKLREELKKVVVGPYQNPETRIGPLTNPDDLARVLDLFIKNKDFIDPATPGIVRAKSQIVEPTIINRHLNEGGNYTEQLAPIFFLHPYESDRDLSQYFENDQYFPNAMYVTVFGNSPYVSRLPEYRFKDGRLLHDHKQIIRNKDLHFPGVERGTQPYGGYGRRASCLMINDKIYPKPTLPQRDIFEQLVYPHMSPQRYEMSASLPWDDNISTVGEESHLDLPLSAINRPSHNSNTAYMEAMGANRLGKVRQFRDFLTTSSGIDPKDIMEAAHRISKELVSENGADSGVFFKDLYNLLVGADRGPRLSTLIESLGKERVLLLLNV